MTKNKIKLRKFFTVVILLVIVYLGLWALTNFLGIPQVRTQTDEWAKTPEQGHSQFNLTTPDALHMWTPCPFLIIVEKRILGFSIDPQGRAAFENDCKAKRYYLWFFHSTDIMR